MRLVSGRTLHRGRLHMRDDRRLSVVPPEVDLMLWYIIGAVWVTVSTPASARLAKNQPTTAATKNKIAMVVINILRKTSMKRV